MRWQRYRTGNRRRSAELATEGPRPGWTDMERNHRCKFRHGPGPGVRRDPARVFRLGGPQAQGAIQAGGRQPQAEAAGFGLRWRLLLAAFSTPSRSTRKSIPSISTVDQRRRVTLLIDQSSYHLLAGSEVRLSPRVSRARCSSCSRPITQPRPAVAAHRFSSMSLIRSAAIVTGAWPARAREVTVQEQTVVLDTRCFRQRR